MCHSIKYLLRITLFLTCTGLTIAQVEKSSQQESLPVEFQPGNWKEFRSREAGFSVAMPGEPKAESSPMETGHGRLEMYRFVLETDLGAYSVSYADFHKYSDELRDVRKILEAGRKSYCQKEHGCSMSTM